jgi:molecular chaperone DnaK
MPPPLPRSAIPLAPPLDTAKGKLPAAPKPPAAAPSPRPALPADELKPEAGGLLRVFRNRVIELLRSLRTVNVNAHSLGVVATTHEGRQRVSVLVPQNTQLPVSVTKRFGTVSDNQPGVTVRVVEGESKEVEECMQVGLCRIQQLPAGLPRGSPVDVTFTYDNSGRLHVKAMEVKSGNWATVLIQRRSGATRTRAEVEAEEQVAGARVS